MPSIKLSQLEDAIGYDFSRRELLEVALTHTSAMSEADREAPGASSLHNEKLEFLGDAVLSLVVGHELFGRFPNFREGQLSKLRAHLVSQTHLIRVARRLSLGAYLRLGKGEERNGGREKAALLVDALEAVLGAIYLDGGLEAVRPVVVSEILEPELAAMRVGGGEELPVTDFKSALQEAAQAAGRARVVYELVEQSGPEHSKLFTVEVRLQRDGSDSSESFRASGPAKKRAEQEAARLALKALFPERWTEHSRSVIDDSATNSTISTDTVSLPVLEDATAATIDPAAGSSGGNR